MRGRPLGRQPDQGPGIRHPLAKLGIAAGFVIALILILVVVTDADEVLTQFSGLKGVIGLAVNLVAVLAVSWLQGSRGSAPAGETPLGRSR